MVSPAFARVAILPPVVAALLAGSASAQSTWSVGPGGYPEIADAIAVAQPGDLIVVQQGVYLPFALSIGVCILAPDGATVTTPPGGGGLPFVHPIHPPVGQRAQIVGLTFATNSAYPPAEPPVALDVTGNVVFADCTFYNYPDFGSEAVICNGDVQFDRCVWTSVWDCMRVVGGAVVLNDCELMPTRVQWAGPDPICISASGGELTLNFCNLTGSAATGSSFLGSPAIRLTGNARLSVADSEVRGGDSMTWASTAIVNSGSLPVYHARSTILGGHGLLSQIPPFYGFGPGVAGAAQAAPLIGGGGVPTGPRIGSNYYGSVVGPTNLIALIVLSFERAPAVSLPIAAQPVHFDPAMAFAYDFGVLNGPSGWPNAGTYIWQTPNLTVAMFGMQFWLHPLVWDGMTFQVGPVAGGVVR